MKTRTVVGIGLGLAVALLAYGYWRMAALPDRVPMHWNARGEIDGYGPKILSIWLMPSILILVTGLLAILPRFSKREFSVERSEGAYEATMLLTIGMMGVMHVLILEATVNQKIDPSKGIMVVIFAFFAIMGRFIHCLRRNEWAGVRTPWTMGSDEVWDATHRYAGRLWTAVGLGGALLSALGLPFWISFTALMIAAFMPVFYSYRVFRQVQSNLP